ncbi:hypothetical protein D3C87_1502130 [compost metagenome]
MSGPNVAVIGAGFSGRLSVSDQSSSAFWQVSRRPFQNDRGRFAVQHLSHADVKLDHKRRTILAGVEGGAGDDRRDSFRRQTRRPCSRRRQHQGEQLRPETRRRVLDPYQA